MFSAYNKRLGLSEFVLRQKTSAMTLNNYVSDHQGDMM